MFGVEGAAQRFEALALDRLAIDWWWGATLAGYDLATHERLEEWSHADILLALVNGPSSVRVPKLSELVA